MVIIPTKETKSGDSKRCNIYKNSRNGRTDSR
nr:MAG TPA: hypothetical protein [Caudoviricetes sp.]DAJ13294.1 MAG TPA: hypothetical protein [Siphoviridae sp. ctX8T1]DAQ77914.1 MAG TPA: hypothetical protein [Caudoviricetes sp.]